jgi:hypothetical protein
MQLGRTIDISFSLEASGELTDSPGDGEWGSDTAAPIVGYYLGAAVPEPASPTLLLVALGGAGLWNRPKRTWSAAR